MTYKDGIFSVVMQPDGADDWVQCFQIKGARLPEKAYFGVTALTGDLVDNHHMLQLSVFSNIEHQPYDHAHENDAGQMPEMWDDMRHSGAVAREFEQWESDFEEELKIDVFSDEYQYSYEDSLWSDSEDYADYKPEDGEEDEYYQNPESYEASYSDYSDDDDAYSDYYDTGKNPKSSAKPKKERGKIRSKNTDQDTVADMAKLLERNGLIEEMKRRSKDMHEKMSHLRLHLEGEVRQIADRLSRTLMDVRRTEQRNADRIAKVASKFDVSIVEPFAKMVEMQGATKHSWKMPFMIMLGFLLAFSALGYSKYRRHMKTHLL